MERDGQAWPRADPPVRPESLGEAGRPADEPRPAPAAAAAGASVAGSPGVIRRLVALLCTVALLAGGAAWWLTRRPLTFAARQGGGQPSLVPLPRSTPPPPPGGAPATGAAAGAASVPAPAATAADDEAPLALAADAVAPVRTQRGPTPRFGRTANYLLVGVDRTRGRALGRADTLIFAAFDDATGHVGLVSIPRDLYVDIPDYGPSRINATLRIGAKLHREPLELLRDVTATTLAVPIQHVIVVDLESFERGIDRLGGLTVDVPCPIDDNFIDPRTLTGRRLLHVATGRQRMDGVTAAMYARSRHGRSDWDRARRQQAILASLRDRAGELGVDTWLPIALDAIEQGVTTTMSRLDMLRLARRAAGVTPERMHGVVIGTRQTEIHWTAEHQAVLFPSYDAIDAQLAGLFAAPAPGLRPANKQCPDAGVAIP